MRSSLFLVGDAIRFTGAPRRVARGLSAEQLVSNCLQVVREVGKQSRVSRKSSFAHGTKCTSSTYGERASNGISSAAVSRAGSPPTPHGLSMSCNKRIALFPARATEMGSAIRQALAQRFQSRRRNRYHHGLFGLSGCRERSVGVRGWVALTWDLIYITSYAMSTAHEKLEVKYPPWVKRGLFEEMSDRINAGGRVDHTSSPTMTPATAVRRLQRLGQSLLFDPSYYWYTALLVLLGDAFLTQVIIRFVRCQTPLPLLVAAGIRK